VHLLNSTFIIMLQIYPIIFNTQENNAFYRILFTLYL